jgi:pimeloyl-ACP methyl ester carboxylesterase
MYWNDIATGTHEYRVPVNSISIHGKYSYREKASRVLFFFHGLGCSADNFSAVLEKEYFRDASLFLFDLPGFGDSDKPGDFPYTMEAFAELAGELIRPFIDRQLFIIAHSMGGGVALLLARDIIEKTAGFVSLEGNLIGADTSVSRTIASFSREEFMETQFPRLKRRFAFSNIMDMTRTDPRALYAASTSLVHWSGSGKLLKKFLGLECKKLYIYGEKNRDMPVLQDLSSVETEMIPNTGHSMMVEQPDALYHVIAGFIDK